MSYQFLRKDYEALTARIDELSAAMREAGEEKGLMASQTSEIWRDNFGFEAEEREQHKLSNRLEDFVAMQNQAEIVDQHALDEAGVGARITVETEDGDQRRFMISSYQVLDKQEEDEVSYAAPLARPFVGAMIGDVREVTIGEEVTRYRLTAIE